MFSIQLPDSMTNKSSEDETSGSWFARNKRLVIIASGASGLLLVVGIIVSFFFASKTPVNVMNSDQLNGQPGARIVRSISVRKSYPPIVALAIKHWPIAAAIAAAVLILIVVVAVLFMRSGEVLEELEDPKKDGRLVRVEELWWEDPFNLGLAAVGSVVFLWLLTQLFSGNSADPVALRQAKRKADSMKYFDKYVTGDNPAVDVKNLRAVYQVAVWSRLVNRISPAAPGSPDRTYLTLVTGFNNPVVAPPPVNAQITVINNNAGPPVVVDVSDATAYGKLRLNFERIAEILSKMNYSTDDFGNLKFTCNIERPNLVVANVNIWISYIGNTQVPITNYVNNRPPITP